MKRRRLLAVGLASAAGISWGRPASGESPASVALWTPAVQQAVDRGLQFLVAQQNDDGSFGTGEYSRNMAVCGLAGMALLSAGHTPSSGKLARTCAKTLQLIVSHTASSGLIHAGTGTGREPMYGHGFATLFLAEAYGTTVDGAVRDALSRAVRLIVGSQNDAGGWRYEPRRHEADVSVTVCQMLALRAARNAGLFVPNETMDRAVAYLRRAQNSDGGFLYMLDHPGESSFPRSAAAVVALMSAGLYDAPEVRRGLEYLQHTAPPYVTLTGHSYFLYGQYYAAQAMWLAGQDPWNRWYPAIRDFLLRHQDSKSGSWYEAISAEYSTAMACLILRMPASYLPIFQR